jgi:hypothetical protein
MQESIFAVRPEEICVGHIPVIGEIRVAASLRGGRRKRRRDELAEVLVHEFWVVMGGCNAPTARLVTPSTRHRMTWTSSMRC